MRKNRLIGCGIISILGIGACAAIGALFFGGLIALTRPVVEASEQFLSLLGQEKSAEAYGLAASGFRAQQDEDSFRLAVKQLGLTDYSSVAWHNRVIENQEGTAEGTVTTKSGETKAISIRLAYEGSKWAVVGVRYGGVDLATFKSPAPAAPPQAKLEGMVAEALLGFNKAVRTRDFTAFYANLATIWKKETTPQKLQQIFREFLDKDIDIGAIKDVNPQFSRSPLVSDRGVLVMAGHFPTEPSQVRFKLQYASESGVWKLMGISVSVGKKDAAE
ncbi:MAG: hypothetical protein ACJ8FY_17380 [Gemmataceae bacterium]